MVSACENIEQIEEEGKLGMSVDVYKQAVSYMLRTGQLAAAAALLQKQMGVHHRLQQPHGIGFGFGLGLGLGPTFIPTLTLTLLLALS